MRQPADPVPAGLRVRLGEHVELHVQRAVQGGRLRHRPPRQAARGVVGTREANHAEPAQMQGNGGVGDVPGDLAAVVVLLGVVEDDGGGQPAGAHPQQQVVGVAAAALPDTGAGAGGVGPDGAGVRVVEAAVAALQDQRLLRVALDPGLVLLVLLDLLGVGLAAVLLVPEVVGDHDQRAEDRDQQVRRAPHHQRHGDGHDERGGRHQPGQRPGLVLLRGRRQAELGDALRRAQPRRAVVVVPGAVVGPLQGRVRGRVIGHVEQGVAEGELGADAQLLPFERLAVDAHLAGPGLLALGCRTRPAVPARLPALPLAALPAAVHGQAEVVRGDHVERQRTLRHLRVVDQQLAARTAAYVVPADAEPEHGAGVGPAGHPDLDDTGLLAGQRAGGVVQAHHRAVAQRGGGDGVVGVHVVVVDIERGTWRPGRGPAPHPGRQLPGNGVDTGLRVGIEDEVFVRVRIGVDDSQLQTHLAPPRNASQRGKGYRPAKTRSGTCEMPQQCPDLRAVNGCRNCAYVHLRGLATKVPKGVRRTGARHTYAGRGTSRSSAERRGASWLKTSMSHMRTCGPPRRR